MGNINDISVSNSVCHVTRKELSWCSTSVVDCRATAQGSIPGGNSVFAEVHVLRKGQ